MRKVFRVTMRLMILSVIALILNGCSAMKAPIVKTTMDDSINNYRYFYMMPSGDYTSSTGVYGNQFGTYGGTTKTTSPSSVISGILFNNGFVQVNEVNPTNSRETLIVSFGETGRRNVNLGYSIEVTIQFVSAATQQLVCSCTAEGQGDTEADDVRIAIHRALSPLFAGSSR